MYGLARFHYRRKCMDMLGFTIEGNWSKVFISLDRYSLYSYNFCTIASSLDTFTIKS